MLLEIQQLLAAEDSPVAAIKEQDVPSFTEEVGQYDVGLPDGMKT